MAQPPSPRTPLPPGSCDCHTHVFLDPRAYPWSPTRRYTPPEASIAELAQLHAALGIARVVVVQPSVYAADNAATLQALRVLGPQRARGVAVIDDAMADAELDAMHALGVRGVRVNLEIDQASDAGHATAQLQRTAARVARLGWHVQVYANLPLLAACAEVLGALPVPVVLDHYAGAHAAGGVQQPGLQAMLALVEAGHAYVKLSAPYRLSAAPFYADMQALARLFLRTRPDRMLWGSDWPHPQPGTRADPHDTSPPFAVDSAQVLDALRAWAGDEATFHRILVDNPARLYGF
ncbi:amidohydrolase family protein [Pseudorhodoferax sp.]|uniref:amidohydrolase family protein n=1 Tax=Pseudorhodoferax sp. TaxID=1993553 RepID=UPI002DD6798B|nr:amidohydrolase family protein [Pseudorhodoferax sp.]